MGAVSVLLEITHNLHGHVASGLPKEEREPYIERLNELLDQRESLLSEIPVSFTEEEKRMGLAILQLNEVVQPLLDRQLAEIKRDITLMNQKKTHSAQYANPYAAVSGDGMFFDKKN
ncbi:flagellar protein FliT [Fictibacillus sp. FJAT-27399]|uniref:flagellar protein FliT n=1 Tax=Fictibacillus sp. FJAT-27399 TaxID=1729689 RepID=UPI00078545F3|nr:flagellar protein FliT [Fictibacillus sp. FJAT-27399]